MKKTKLIYWIFTGIFAAFMAFSAIPDMLVTKDAHDFMAALGYPDYFTRFIGVAKLLGCVAIILPGFPRIKEWAYAGFFFDLVGATYSMMFLPEIGLGWTFMLAVLGFWLVSYIYYHKLLKAAGNNA
jgi:hypothetical protein